MALNSDTDTVLSVAKYHSHVPWCPKRGFKEYRTGFFCTCKAPAGTVTDNQGRAVADIDEDGVTSWR